MEIINYEYLDNEKLKARQYDLKVLVDALYLSMKNKGIMEYIFQDEPLVKKCGRREPSYIFIEKLFLKEKGKSVYMQYILSDYIDNNPISRKCSVKQVLTSYITNLTDALIEEGLIDLSIKDKMNALENYNTQYKEYLDNKKKTTSTITVDKE